MMDQLIHAVVGMDARDVVNAAVFQEVWDLRIARCDF